MSKSGRSRGRQAAQAVAVLAALATAVATTADTAQAVPPSKVRVTPDMQIYRSHLTKDELAKLSQRATDKVIILLKNQYTSGTPFGPIDTPSARANALAERATTLAAAQAPLVSELKTVNAQHIKTYKVTNAVSATVSAAEAEHLRSNPAVMAVVPDSKVAGPTQPTFVKPAAVGNSSQQNTTPGICKANGPLLEPEALSRMGVIAESKIRKNGVRAYDGSGVKVAVFPDGLDPTIPDFQRPDGTPVIFDYNDFTGEGKSAPTAAEEAFGDVSSIASQGNETFSLNGEINPNVETLPANCTIRIRGVSPGASVAVEKIFGSRNYAVTSIILQAIDQAVTPAADGGDGVDILSQSFGGNPIPNPGIGADPIAVADEDAVAAGVTVVASTGDAGVTNTIGSPASGTGHGIISTAASTDFRLYAQTDSYGYALGHDKGWLDDQVSSFSSSGLQEYGPATPDVIAPGEASFADCSRNTAIYTECADIYHGNDPQPIVPFGGTSESCPLTAGAAALVIQAYRDTHRGASPTPKQVEQIISSSATDMHVPSQDQGAGLVNAQHAVELATTIPGSGVTPTKKYRRVLFSTNRLAATTRPGATVSSTVRVTNESPRAKTFTPTLKTFARTKNLLSGYPVTSVSYPGGPAYGKGEFVYFTDGHNQHYLEKDFTVPAGADRLISRIAWQTSGNNAGTTVRATLFAPNGKFAADSRPQGKAGGVAEDTISHPMAGKWRLILFSVPGDLGGAPQAYDGPVRIQEQIQHFVHRAQSTITPASATIQPGQTKAFKVTYTAKKVPGDADFTLSFGPYGGVIPVTTRTTVPTSVGHPGHFSGRITGGNERAAFYGQELTYKVDVPSGLKDLDADVTLQTPGYDVYAFLVDPNNMPRTVQSTDVLNTDQNNGGADMNGQTIHLSVQRPMAGRWTLDLAQVANVDSVTTSARVTGTISFNQVQVNESNVPQGGSVSTVPQGGSRVATIHIRNMGNQPEIYYLDPRVTGDGGSAYGLPALSPPTGTLPLGSVESTIPQFLVAPDTTIVDINATTSGPNPIEVDSSPAFGYPDFYGGSKVNQALQGDSTTVDAVLTGPDLPSSEYSCDPAEIGPYTATDGVAPPEPYDCSASAELTDTFNTDVTSRGGNVFQYFTTGTNPWDPSQSVLVRPGDTAELQATFSPSAAPGTTVKGYLAVETFNQFTLGVDDLKHIPYTYTVGSPPAA